MARSMPRSSAAGSRRGALRPWALLLGAGLAAPAARSFASPTLLRQEQALQSRAALTGQASQPIAGPRSVPAGRRGVTATEAVAEGVGAKVLAAMSAGAVAAVVQAMLSSVTEPIVNRVLVKRMGVKEAMAEITPAMIASFFMTTISTNLIKFPLFEAVAMFVALLPDMSTALKGIVVGFVFTTATLPITNFRYRMSIQTPVSEAMKPGVLYQAYVPTVIRDMVYAMARGALTGMLLAKFAGLSATSPAMLFAVVLGSCIISAPFNEIRGYLLQSSGRKLTFGEFFKPINFVRSTSLGALNQAIALATGYYLTPIVAKVVMGINSALDTGSWKAFIAVVAALDVLAFVISKSASKSGVMSSEMMQKLKKMEADSEANRKMIEQNKETILKLQKQNEELLEGAELKSEIEGLKAAIKDLPAQLKSEDRELAGAAA